MTDRRALGARPRASEHEARPQTRAPESSARASATDQIPPTERKSSARAEASRRNGAKSRGPRAADGKARSAQNALKHGLRAQKPALLADEDLGEFQALEETLRAELAPGSALQELLVGRIVLAAWRMLRVDRMEIELLDPHIGRAAPGQPGSPGLALIRDCYGPRAFATLLRYRGAVQAEFWRSLRALSALKAEAPAPLELAATAALHADARSSSPAEPAPAGGSPSANEPQPIRVRTNPSGLHEAPARWSPHQPERYSNLPDAPARWNPEQHDRHRNLLDAPARRNPNEPETRGDPGVSAGWSMPDGAQQRGEAAAGGTEELVPCEPRRS